MQGRSAHLELAARLAAIVEIVTSLGGEIEASGDALRVAARPLRGGAVSSRGDHRLAMLGAVAGLVCPAGVSVSGFGAAATTFPGFTEVLADVLPA